MLSQRFKTVNLILKIISNYENIHCNLPAHWSFSHSRTCCSLQLLLHGLLMRGRVRLRLLLRLQVRSQAQPIPMQ